MDIPPLTLPFSKEEIGRFEAFYRATSPPVKARTLQDPGFQRDKILGLYFHYKKEPEKAREFALSVIENPQLIPIVKEKLKLPPIELSELFFQYFFFGLIAGEHEFVPSLKDKVMTFIKSLTGFHNTDVAFLMLNRDFGEIVDFVNRELKYERFSGKHYLNRDYEDPKNYYRKVRPEWEFSKAIYREDPAKALDILKNTQRYLGTLPHLDALFYEKDLLYPIYVIMHDILVDLNNAENYLLFPHIILW